MQILRRIIALTLLFSAALASAQVEIPWTDIKSTPTTAAGYGILNGAKIDAAAALTWSANTAPYYTGNATISSYSLTAFARGVLASVDAAAWRAATGSAPLDSAALTGTPTAPTAALDTATTQLATTAFVRSTADARTRAPRGGISNATANPVGITPDGPALSRLATSDFTLGVWYRSGGTISLVNKSSTTAGVYAYASSTGLVFWLGDGVGSSYTFPSVTLTDGNTHFVAVTCVRGGNAQGYQDGAPIGSAVSTAARTGSLATSNRLEWGGGVGGTLGESWIVLGALSASRCAAIQRAGSIAPFVTWTWDAEKGQHVGTVDGFAFLTWPDFERADPNYNPIARDRSGTNVHAVIAVTGLAPVIRTNWLTRVLGPAVVSDGSPAARAYAALNGQNPGTGDVLLSWEGIYPQEVSGPTRRLVALTQNITSVGQGRSFQLAYVGSEMRILLYGPLSSDIRTLASSQLHAAFQSLGARGIPCRIDVRRSATGIKVFAGIGGDGTRYYDVTALFSESTSGSNPPAWTDEIVGTYMTGFVSDSVVSTAGHIAQLALYNFAPTEANLRAEYERGSPAAELMGASRTAIYRQDFSSGDGTWTNGSGTVAWSGSALTCTYSTAGQYVNAPVNLLSYIGRRVRVAFTIANCTSATGTLELRSSVSNSVLQSINLANGTYANDLTLPASYAGATLVLVRLAGGAVSFDLDNVSITQLGYTAILDPAIAAGLTAINPSRGTSNDSTDWLFSTTGITAPSSNRTQTIRWTTSAAGNQQLFGAPCIDTTGRWRIRSWTIYTTGTPTVSLGNISAGTAYANGVTLVAGVNDITVATRTPGTANLWCNSSTNASLEHVVLLDRVD